MQEITAPDPIVATPVSPETGTPMKVGIEQPPDHIFKHRKNRLAPAQDVWGRTVSYAPQRAEYIEGKGAFVWYYGVPFPSKTVAPIEAIYAINGVKRLLISTLRVISSREAWIPMGSLILIGRRRRATLLNTACTYFNAMADVMVAPYYMDDGYYCGVVKEIRKFTETLLINLGVDEATGKKTAEIIGMLFEYDNAYRFRLHDVMNEANKEAFLTDFPKEIKRLLQLMAVRENLNEKRNWNDVTNKFETGGKILKVLWYIPFLRKSLKRAIESMDFNNWKLDEADIYHTLLFSDYNVQGKTLDERVKIMESYHGTDMEKWPPRIEIRSKNA